MGAPLPDPIAPALDALVALIAQRVVAELRPLLSSLVPSPNPPPLVDKRELARTLTVSPATITRLVQDGAPHTFVGSSPRFDVEAFRAWLDGRGRQRTKAPESKQTRESIPGVRLLSRGGR